MKEILPIENKQAIEDEEQMLAEQEQKQNIKGLYINENVFKYLQEFWKSQGEMMNYFTNNIDLISQGEVVAY